MTTFEYDIMDNLSKVTLHRVDEQDGVDEYAVTLYEYDGRGLQTKVVDALGNVTVHQYDGNGNLIKTTDADGYVTEYTMDALDLIEHINYNGGKQVDYAYNKTGDLVKMEDWSGTTTFEVDLLHRITATTDRLGKHVAYTYDGVGNQTSVSYPDGTTATKEYDLVKNLTKVIEEDGRTTTYTYDGMRRVTHMNYPDGWQEDYHYDAIGQLTAIEDTDPTQKDMKQQKNTFEYDVCGNMIHEYMRGNGTGETTTDVTYTYDELHRVTSAKELYGNAWRNYQYDSLGNLTWEDNSNSAHYDYKMNNLNQVTEKHYSTNDKEGTLYTYDKRGNLVLEEYGKLNGNENGQKRQTVAQYTYDETNKMVEGTNSIGESSSYLFNGKNALVEQTWHIAKNGYGYHDVDATEEDLAAIAELARGKGGNGSGGNGHGNGNGQGNGNGSGDKPTGTLVGDFSTVVKQFVIDYTVETMDPLMEHEVNGLDYRYVYGNERLSVNISPIPNGAGHVVESGTVGQQIRLYYHQDLRGTVDYLTSPVSQKVESWTHYNEWGEITHNAVLKMGQRELDLVKNYTGHDFDAVLNMYYAKARMYDAENRRFVSIDPILDGTKYDLKDYTTEAINFSAYVYVKDNPLRWIDPLGLMAVGDGGAAETGGYGYPEVNYGATGYYVTKLQTILQEAGYYTDKVDGHFGKNTTDAVKAFQRNNGLKEDGSVGNMTWTVLLSGNYISNQKDRLPKPVAPTVDMTPDPFEDIMNGLEALGLLEVFEEAVSYTQHFTEPERLANVLLGAIDAVTGDTRTNAPVILEKLMDTPLRPYVKDIYLKITFFDALREAAGIPDLEVTYLDSYYLGRTLGDMGVALVGSGITGVGLTMEGAGNAATLTGGAASASGVGATAGVPAMAIGISVSAAGAVTTGLGATAVAAALAKLPDDWGKFKEYQNKFGCGGTGDSTGQQKPAELKIEDSQLGKKYGEHKVDYPDLDYSEYRQLAQEVFTNPDEIRVGYASGESSHLEYFYIKGNNLLRVLPDGSFVSLYPGASSGIVQSATCIFIK